MENKNIKIKQKSRKKNWILILALFVINLACLGLLIWGIVELIINSGYSSDIKGGLLVGIDGFIILFSIINLASFFTNNSEYKNDVINLFKSNKKVNSLEQKVGNKND